MTAPSLGTRLDTDLTATITDEDQVAMFVAIDHCKAECVGTHADRYTPSLKALQGKRSSARSTPRLARHVCKPLILLAFSTLGSLRIGLTATHGTP